MKRRWFINRISSFSLLLSLPPLLKSCSKEPLPPTNTQENPDDAIDYNSLSDYPIASLSQNSFELLAKATALQLVDYNMDGYSVNESYPSPTIRTSRGELLSIDFNNQIGSSCIIHWHGLIVPPLMDGHPSLAVAHAEHYAYEFEIIQRAGTYFYHSHTHGLTGNQVYRGIAGFFIIEDEEEKALNLPSGTYEIPLLIQDKRTYSTSDIVYNPSRMEARMDGFLGDQIFVNGIPNAKHQVKKGVYRLRLLNGSNARILTLQWSNQMEFTLIGSDGGLLEVPYQLTQVLLAPAERIDILVDFSNVTNKTVKLISAENTAIATQGGMMGSNFVQGSPMDLVLFEVQDETGISYNIPNVLSTIEYPSINEVDRSRSISLDMLMQAGHAINGRQYHPQQIEFEVPQGSVELWEFTNNTNNAHPMHLHGVQFKVIDKTKGVHQWEKGLKDTVLVLPGEVVKILIHFTAQPGLYLFHCHNLEHEDAGMMLNYAII